MSSELVRVTVRVSFNGMYAGDVGYVLDGEMLRGWERAGLVEVCGGKDQAGPGGVVPDNPGSVPERTGDGGPAGDEPGEDPGPRRHRKVARVNPH
jgi:hypothetical protein